MYKLKNREFVFDVDVSSLPCGVNGAMYFVQMDADGCVTSVFRVLLAPRLCAGLVPFRL